MLEWMCVSWETEERAPIGIVVEKERRSGRREGWRRGRRSGRAIVCVGEFCYGMLKGVFLFSFCAWRCCLLQNMERFSMEAGEAIVHTYGFICM